MVFSFFNRQNEDNIRVVLKQFKDEMSRAERQKYILESPTDEVFDVKKPNFEVPKTARLFNTVICDKCGEGVPEHKIRINKGEKFCLDCFEEYTRGW